MCTNYLAFRRPPRSAEQAASCFDNQSYCRVFKGKLAMKMETGQKHQKRLGRAVYPNGTDKRGYQVVLAMQDAKRFAIPHWLTKWAGRLTP
jgi:hypothetical protein